MSYDFFTSKICTHGVAQEKIILNANDRQSAQFLKPPSNNRINVRVDGEIVPQSGLFSYPEITFSRPEPYRIKKGVNDLLLLSMGFDPPVFVELISGSLKATDLSRYLQNKYPNLYVYIKNGHISIRSRTRGKFTAFQFHNPVWTDSTSSLPTTERVLAAYKTLGILPGRAATGKKIFPGWSVRLLPTDPLQREKILLFNESLRNENPLIEVSYVTNELFCRRCHGTRTEFDYVIENNSYATVMNTDLLSQEFDKFLFTKIGSHWKWNWLGSGLIERIGGKGSTNQSTVNSMITVDISQAFSTYQNIKQQQDSRTPQQRVSDAEYPSQIVSIDVKGTDDPTIAIVTTTIASRSRIPVPLTRVIGNPNPFTLQGDPETNIKFRFRG